MATREQIEQGNRDARNLLKKAAIQITGAEAERIEYCDYGLNDFYIMGTEILTYVNTDRVCAKELMLMPYQICPQHIHPQLGKYMGKEETFRCRWGDVYLYVPGEPTPDLHAKVPPKYKEQLSVWHEIHLCPGEQYTLKEQTLHWFQAGAEGAVISEFSTPSFDEQDIFSDPQIKRQAYY